ncbi:hypothetical protein ZWY2020_014936 [Hordeum vulgare]|nr:hypothetical protein ZWY2020_014936 [Hordeum vulgare]
MLLLLMMTLLPLLANTSSKQYIVYMGEKNHDDQAVVISSHHDVLTYVFGSLVGSSVQYTSWAAPGCCSHASQEVHRSTPYQLPPSLICI